MFYRFVSLLALLALAFVPSKGIAQASSVLAWPTSGEAPFSHPFAEDAEGIARRGWLEMGAVGLTGAGHLGFSALDQNRLFIPTATLGWGAYVVYRTRTARFWVTSA